MTHTDATEDAERKARCIREHDNPVMPFAWCSTDGGINYCCPNCHEALWGRLDPEPGGRRHWCDAGRGGCGATWTVNDDGTLTSSLGPCVHAAISVKSRRVVTWEVLGDLPKNHGFPADKWLLRYHCGCGLTHFQLAPDPTWV